MTTAPATPPPDLISLAVRFLDTMLDSADVETIGRINWWDRARTALEAGAGTGTAFSEVVSKTASKLQITGALQARTSTEIDKLTRALADPGTFAEWRELCQRDAVYITAMTRVTRTSRKATAA